MKPDLKRIVPLFIFILLWSSLSWGQGRDVSVIPEFLEWNTQTSEFDFFFKVKNDSRQKIRPWAAVEFKAQGIRRRKGLQVSTVFPNITEQFCISFGPSIMLKNDYYSISINLYRKKYRELLDSTDSHYRVRSQRSTGKNKILVKISSGLFNTLKHVSFLGNRKELAALKKMGIKKISLRKTSFEEKQRLVKITYAGLSDKRKKETLRFEDKFPDKLASPKALLAKPGNRLVVLKWDRVEGASGYTVYWSRSKNASQNKSAKIRSMQNEFRHKGLKNGVTYYYFVTATNPKTESIQSYEVSAVPQLMPPEQPELLITPGDKVVKVNWREIPYAESFNLYWSDSPGVNRGSGKKVSGVGKGHTFKNLENGRLYYFVLTAVNEFGESIESRQISAIPRLLPLNAPTVSASAGDGKVVLSWKNLKGVTGYNLYWSTTPKVEKSEAKRLLNIESGFEHKGLINNQPYYYVISAVNRGGEGELSREISAVPGIPSTVTVSIAALLSQVDINEFLSMPKEPGLMVNISDIEIARNNNLQRAKKLETLDISSRNELISLYIAEGKSESIATVLKDQIKKKPEDVNLSLTLSKVYHEQGNETAALNVLKSSLSRISLSARVALNQELKTSVKKGESTLSKQSDEAYLANEFSTIGQSFLEKQKFSDALLAFQSLYAMAKDYPLIKYNLGQSRRGMKQYNQAQNMFHEQSLVKEIKRDELLADLFALSDVLPYSLEVPIIITAKRKFLKLSKNENSPKEKKKILKYLAFLDELLDRAEQRRLEGLPDLVIAFGKKFKLEDIQPGQDIYLDFVVKNIGQKNSAEFKINYQLMHEQDIIYDIMEFDHFQAIPSAGESLAWNKKLVIPADALPGKYSIIANLEQVEGKGEVSLQNNRVFSEPVIHLIPAVSDLKINLVNIISRGEINPFEDVEASFQVENIGYKDSPGFTVYYKLKNENGSIFNLKDADKMDSVAKGGGAISWKKKIEIPSTLGDGKYQLLAQIQPEDSAQEVNKENNQVSSGSDLSFVPPFVDLALVFQGNLAAQAVLAGRTISPGFYLRNYGNVDSAAVKIEYQLKHEDGNLYSFKEADTYSSVRTRANAVLLEKELRIPKDLVSGKYQLIASLQMKNSEQDINIENNTAASGFDLKIVSAFSDLQLSFAKELNRKTIMASGELEVEFNVSNNGNDSSEPAYVHYFIKSKQKAIYPLPGKTFLETVPANNRSMSWVEKIRFPENMKEGSYQLIAQLNLENADFEREESNNRVESDKDLFFVPARSSALMIRSIYPGKNASGIKANSKIGIGFSALLDSGSISSNSLVVITENRKVSGRLDALGKQMTFVPDKPLKSRKTYRVQLMNNIKDRFGNTLDQNISWSFTTL